MSLNVIALGGNAILEKDPSDQAQKETVQKAAKYIADFIESGEQVVICHGNGPQVGNLLLQQKAANGEKNPALKLDSCVAMTEGSIGYWIQNALSNEFLRRNIEMPVVSMITQVRVDEEDPSFKNPTKPIGPFYTKDEAVNETKDGSVFKEDAGRGYRKVVPSPMPQEIVEKKAVQQMVAGGILPVCAGGGGVPVVLKEDRFEGVEAVNDKDFSAKVLAENIDADQLIILTGVDNIYINFNTPKQKALETISVSEAESYISEGHYAAGSMLPKIEAAIAFVKNNPRRKAIITSIENLKRIKEGAGTTVVSG
ncbi:carbamate kinase 2 [Enterococcus florum]|uniref:Carbamate kinase n=1 Tax=Enterococcus florum TaxID=2480627 RepID=A0A4V0WPW4_9ENTE|nr:carbamate kinase [Enterococcus florum]GCF95269.1 carbamate kinase 2 [Enterococcus florum]